MEDKDIINMMFKIGESIAFSFFFFYIIPEKMAGIKNYLQEKFVYICLALPVNSNLSL